MSSNGFSATQLKEKRKEKSIYCLNYFELKIKKYINEWQTQASFYFYLESITVRPLNCSAIRGIDITTIYISPSSCWYEKTQNKGIVMRKDKKWQYFYFFFVDLQINECVPSLSLQETVFCLRWALNCIPQPPCLALLFSIIPFIERLTHTRMHTPRLHVKWRHNLFLATFLWSNCHYEGVCCNALKQTWENDFKKLRVNIRINTCFAVRHI